jgi:hypothetical protein
MYCLIYIMSFPWRDQISLFGRRRKFELGYQKWKMGSNILGQQGVFTGFHGIQY